MTELLKKKECIKEQQEKELLLKKEAEEKELLLKKERNNTITDDFIMDKMAIESEDLVFYVVNAFKDENHFLNNQRFYKMGFEACNPVSDIISDKELFSGNYYDFVAFKLRIIELSKYLKLKRFWNNGCWNATAFWIIDKTYKTSPALGYLRDISYSPDNSKTFDWMKNFEKYISFSNIKCLVTSVGAYCDIPDFDGFKRRYYSTGWCERETKFLHVELNFHQYNIKNLGGFLY